MRNTKWGTDDFIISYFAPILVKGKTHLGLTKHHAMKKYGRVKFHAFVTSAVGECQYSASYPGHFIHGESRRWPLDKKLGRSQSLSGRGDEKIPLFFLPGIDSLLSSL